MNSSKDIPKFEFDINNYYGRPYDEIITKLIYEITLHYNAFIVERVNNNESK